jgi:type IV fimbrial biogenesis protein FimT
LKYERQYNTIWHCSRRFCIDFCPKGYTLLELFVTIAIVGILMLVAVPSWQSFMLRERQQIVVQQLISELQETQTTAISRGENTILCASSDEEDCSENWQQKHIIKVENLPQILQVFPSLTDSIKISWRSSLGLNQFIKFTASGFTEQQGSFYICPKKSSEKSGYRIRVLRSGRARVETFQCQ